jgi:chemotaxis protein methyltransferase CheR
MSNEPVREFELTAGDFRRVQALIKARVGIDLGTNKQSLVYGRLARRLRALGMHHFADYLALVEDPGSDEAERFVNAITTNVTEFFRENHHFEFVARTVLPAIWRRSGPGAQRVRFWSAGCSTGEEPYSLAMVLRENPPLASAAGAWDIKVLATDLDTDVLAHARAGLYPAERVEKIAPSRLKRFFAKTRAGGTYQASAELRSLITFKQLNLMDPSWPMQGPFDLIFCRNVVIYFDDATKHALVQRYRKLLGAGGYLLLGHSESMVGSTSGFDSCGRTIYRRAG